MPGRPMSRSTTSGRWARATSMAAGPSWATWTSCPRSFSSLARPLAVSSVVVDDEDAGALRERRAAASPAGSTSGRPAPPGGQADGELAPLAGALARGRDAPAVHLDELLDERQADPEPALGAGQRAVPLGEEVEDAGQQLGRDADARVPDLDDDVRPLAAGRERDAAPGVGVLGGVGQEVDEDLLEPDRVGLEPQGPRGERDGQLVLPLLDERADGLDGTADDRREVERLLAELDLAPRDAGDVQQVVDQPGQVPDLPLDDLLGPFELLLRLQLAEELDGVADRRQRVPQLVGEHRQELVLAAVGLQPLGLDELLRGDVAADLRGPDDRGPRRRGWARR